VPRRSTNRAKSGSPSGLDPGGWIGASLGELVADDKYRVIVAEDDEAFLQVVAGVLADDGRFEVVGLARNGRDAVELAERLPVDVVVMDIEMPVCDGVEATRLLQETAPGVQVVAISGHDYEERVLEIREAGAVDYVRKSRIDDDLVAVLEALVLSLHKG
jgi:DNA-binding NarL/FixJ family response regulator